MIFFGWSNERVRPNQLEDPSQSGSPENRRKGSELTARAIS
jgi:hypothetical protein